MLPHLPSPAGETPLTDTWGGLPLLQEILSSHRPLLRHIPKGCQAAWGSGLAHALNRLLQDRTWEAFAALCAYPKVTLGLPHRGGKQHRTDQLHEVRRRITQFSSGAWLALWNSSVEGTRQNPQRLRKRPRQESESDSGHMLDPGFLRGLQGFLDDGAYSKATKHLLSEGLHEPR